MYNESFVFSHPCLMCCRGMMVQVGELGVLRFGGAGAVAPLHALGRPFTDADGPRVLAQMRFAQVCCACRQLQSHHSLLLDI